MLLHGKMRGKEDLKDAESDIKSDAPKCAPEVGKKGSTIEGVNEKDEEGREEKFSTRKSGIKHGNKGKTIVDAKKTLYYKMNIRKVPTMK